MEAKPKDPEEGQGDKSFKPAAIFGGYTSDPRNGYEFPGLH